MAGLAEVGPAVDTCFEAFSTGSHAIGFANVGLAMLEITNFGMIWSFAVAAVQNSVGLTVGEGTTN